MMVRAILGGEESTNLDAHVFVLGSEPENEGDPEGHNDNFLISALSLFTALLIWLFTLSVIRLRLEIIDDDEFEDSTNSSVRFDGN